MLPLAVTARTCSTLFLSTSQRVLILDDEPLIAMLLHDWLEELGYEAIGPANTVAQALAFVENDRLDAAILDVSLHKTDCYPVADVLKARGP
jgi:CheY-like chemotaxis protein